MSTECEGGSDQLQPLKGQKSHSTRPRKALRWTLELHQAFEKAVDTLGGPRHATPRGILDLMKAPGVTILHVKSHLQKYRLLFPGNPTPTVKQADRELCCQDQIPAVEVAPRASASLILQESSPCEPLSFHEALNLDYIKKQVLSCRDSLDVMSASESLLRNELVDKIVLMQGLNDRLRNRIQMLGELKKTIEAQDQFF